MSSTPTPDSESGSNNLDRSDWETFPADSQYKTAKRRDWQIDVEKVIELIRDGRLELKASSVSSEVRSADTQDLTITLKGNFPTSSDMHNRIVRPVLYD